MKKNLSSKESILLSSMLFGMFFGAGNLIFPAALGIAAGKNLFVAYLGLFITAVGLPLLAVAALGMSRCSGVLALSSKISRRYGVFFSTLLYLTIGPLFAIPRCASTSFSVGAVNLIGEANEKLALVIFSGVFFAVVLLFSLKPSKIMTWIGKLLNPVFLVFLGTLVVIAMLRPIDTLSSVTPAEAYATGGTAFFSGFLEGYNTLDALAGLAFGIVVVREVKSLGVEEPERVAASTAKAGIFSCLFMGLIYLAITLVAARSSSVCAECGNGGAVLGTIANYYFGKLGALLMTGIVTMACLKTAVGLVISCSEAFADMFPKGPKYTVWAVLFSLVSFGIANFGLSTIVAYCVPVLMFIYPLAMTLILLALCAKFFNDSKTVYVWTTAFTLCAAVFDLTNALSGTMQGSGFTNTALLDAVTAVGAKLLPLYSLGLGWVCPALLGFVIGLIIDKSRKKA